MGYDEKKEKTDLYRCKQFVWLDNNKHDAYHRDFKWLSKEELKSFDVMSLDKESPVGYFFEYDIAYSGYFHKRHNDLSFLPENKIPKGYKNTSVN
jgi:hypothetical protein